MRSTTKVADLTIPNGQTTSNVYPYYVLEDCETFTLFNTPGSDTTKSYNIQLSDDGSNWYNWTDGSSNIVAPAANSSAATYGNPGTQYLRLLASAAVASTSAWHVQKSGYQINAR